MEGFHDFILNEEIQFDHLSLMVKIKKDELINTLLLEGFKRVKFENRKPSQIGNGLQRCSLNHGKYMSASRPSTAGIDSHSGRVEISRKYIQHIRSVRAPVIYEIETILKRHKIEYKIWNAKVRDYITSIVDNHRLNFTPKIPAMRWRFMIIYAGIILAFNAMKLFASYRF